MNGQSHKAVFYGVLLPMAVSGFASLVSGQFFIGSHRTTEGRVTAAKRQIDRFTVALRAFKADSGAYPRTEVGLNSLVTGQDDSSGGKESGLKLMAVPMDPWGHRYLYVCPGRHNTNSYDLISCGPDGLAGTKDDITNWQ